MSRPEDRLQSVRICGEFPLVLDDEKGVLIDDHALAHDISAKGFKLESNGVLRMGQLLCFRIQFNQGPPMSGRARVVLVERADLVLWAGVEFIHLSWSDRRRLRRITHPSAVKWDIVVDKALAAAFLITVTWALWGALSSYIWRSLILDLAPKVLATLAMGWALREMLRPRR
ncbi:MAG: PilZ domain-containing protein [Elusimicrobiota bacterium]